MDPVWYANEIFGQLKSFMNRQPKSWAKTGNPAVDAANQVRFQLKDTAEDYARSIRTSLKNAARIYKMGSRMEVTILDPQTPNERSDAEQQRKAAAIYKEFEAYIREHGIWLIDPPEPKPPVLKWYYYDKDNIKRGPVSDGQVKLHVAEGIIDRETLMESTAAVPSGFLPKQGKACQIQGLFTNQTAASTSPTSNTKNVSSTKETSNPEENNNFWDDILPETI
jgi:hypothetical protein